MSKTDPVNIANPAGSSDPKLGDDYIRTLAKAVIELISKDHYVGTATDNAYDEDAAGEHRIITLNAPQADHPTNVANKGHLYTKDVNGKVELFFQDEDGNHIQLTETGKILFDSLSDIDNDTYLKGVDKAGTGTVDLIKAGRNEADDADVAILPDAVRTATNAAPDEDTGVANKKYVDDQITANKGQVAEATISETTPALTTDYQDIVTKQVTTKGGTIMLLGVIRMGPSGAGQAADVKLHYDGDSSADVVEYLDKTVPQIGLEMTITGVVTNLPAGTYTFRLAARENAGCDITVYGDHVPTQLVIVEI